eukprot:55679_1
MDLSAEIFCDVVAVFIRFCGGSDISSSSSSLLAINCSFLFLYLGGEFLLIFARSNKDKCSVGLSSYSSSSKSIICCFFFAAYLAMENGFDNNFFLFFGFVIVYVFIAFIPLLIDDDFVVEEADDSLFTFV